MAAIETLCDDTATIADLTELLIATVAGGGSVGFMHPLARADAAAFWREALAAAARGDRIVLGAREDGSIVATITLAFAPWPNQPHRAEIAKLMTLPAHRGHGLARALLAEAERIAAERGRTLLTLDTAEEDGAGSFYERLAYTRCGLIPAYAIKPHGGLTGTILYSKRL